MDDSWRFRPIPDNHQLCPVCSIPHYPFCHPPPHFAGDNHRFFHSDIRPPLFHRPFYNISPSNGSEPSQPPFYPPPFLHEEAMDRESFRKRTRIEDPSIGVCSPFHPFNRSLTLDDERRLNLIRNHGREGTTQVQDEHHWNNSDYRMDRDRNDVMQKHFSSGRIDHGLLESSFDNRDGRFQAKAYEGYRNQPISCLDREQKRDIERTEFDSDRRGTYDPQIGDSYPYGRSDQLDKKWQVPRFHESNEVLGGSEIFASNAPGESFLKDSWRSASYYTNDDNPLRLGNFHDQQQAFYSANDENPLRVGNFHDQHQDHPSLSTSFRLLKQPPHPQTDNYCTAPHHQDHAAQNHMKNNYEFYKHQGELTRPSASFDHWSPIPGEVPRPLDPQTFPAVEQLGPHTSKQVSYSPVATDNHVMGTSMAEHGHSSQAYSPIPPHLLFSDVNHVMGTSIQDHGHISQAYPSVPPQPLFPIQTDSSSSNLQVTSSASATLFVVSSVGANSSAKRKLSVHGSQSLPQGEFYNEPPVQASNGLSIEGSPFIRQPSSNFDERGPSFLAKHSLKEKPVYIDARHLFKQPYRASRPDHILIILRGLPGSGKSYLAKALRDIEVENGGSAPRIHAMDDYFMIEVEKKAEDNEGFKSSGSVRSKKHTTKKVIEYCYEPEMEEAYRSSMLKAFKKTLDDGIFTFVIVDDRNLRVADFAQFWAVAKRSGYEVYLLEATYKDPAGCAARNIHGFKLADIQKMADQWEEAPPLYMHLDIQSLLGGDNLIDQSIQEVDMDADDTEEDGEAYHLQETDDCNSTELKSLDQESNYGSTKLGKRWNTDEEEVGPGKNQLQTSKWSKDLSVDLHDSKSAIGNTSALSGLIQAYGKGAKCVHWGDKVETSGFSIGANKKQCASSLIIGTGAGYNLKSNPLPEDNAVGEASGKINNETKRLFNEKLRAERESFRAVFDRRRQRVGGLWDADDE